jgi:hypothetical protein
MCTWTASSSSQLGRRGRRTAWRGSGEHYWEILGIYEGVKEDKAGWSVFLKHLKAQPGVLAHYAATESW